ncbi:MAG: hypothetical protein IAG10_23830 [Planctomycetaceae bacterium]|nr:hypothetical protein [Planctomycetaceae bacterium]
MGRKILSLLLMVTTLCGQSLCCCTFETLGSALKGEASTDSCCCHTTADSTEGCPDSSKGPGHECPCKNGKVVSANLTDVVAVPVASSDGWARQFAFVPQLGRPSLVEVVQLKATYIRSTAFPRLDGVGILRAVNSLRC